jgi:putative transposase
LTERIDTLREAFRVVKNAHPFVIDAVVILPDHLYTLWTLPQGDDEFSLRWRQIKSAFFRTDFQTWVHGLTLLSKART